MHHKHGLVLTDAAEQIVAWCRHDVPSGRMPGGGESSPPAASPLAVLVRAYAKSLGVSVGGAQATIKAAFGITMLGIDVDLTAVDPQGAMNVHPTGSAAALLGPRWHDADLATELATSLFLRKINVAVAVPVAVAAARGAGSVAVGVLIGRIVDAATLGPSFDPFDEAHLAAFTRELVANGMVLHRGDTVTSLAAAMAAALERLASATRVEAVAVAWADALAALGLAGCKGV